MINWPAIIKFSNDAELVYITNQSCWDNDAELQLTQFDESDCLIDSSGAVFNLTNIPNTHIQIIPTGESKTLTEILGLVKEHSALSGSCCIAKLYAPTILDAYKMVEATN